MAKKSGSKGSGKADFEDVVHRLKKDASPALARALDLDQAEAFEAALNTAVEMALAARAYMRALPMPPESREHLNKAEQEALRAARLAVKSFGKARRGGPGAAGPKKVPVDFKSDASPNRSKSRKRARR